MTGADIVAPSHTCCVTLEKSAHLISHLLSVARTVKWDHDRLPLKSVVKIKWANSGNLFSIGDQTRKRTIHGSYCNFQILFQMALKHVYYHVRNELPVYVWYRIQDAWGWCTGMIQTDDMGWEVGGGFRIRNSCTPVVDSCQYMAKPIYYCKAK